MTNNSRPSSFSSDWDNQLNESSVSFANDKICGEGASCIVYETRLGGLRVAVKRLRQENLLLLSDKNYLGDIKLGSNRANGVDPKF